VLLLGDQYHWTVVSHMDSEWLYFSTATPTGASITAAGPCAGSAANISFTVRPSTSSNGEHQTMTTGERLLIEQARKLLSATVRRGRTLTSPDEVRDFLLFTLALREQEVFGVLLLDNRNRVLLWRELFYGTLNQTAVYPREVVKLALQHNAAAVILVHNHPSGHPEASEADIALTRRLQQAMALIDVRIPDHFIVAGDHTVSMAERGLL
jgi:DNA repair protein RadC